MQSITIQSNSLRTYRTSHKDWEEKEVKCGRYRHTQNGTIDDRIGFVVLTLTNDNLNQIKQGMVTSVEFICSFGGSGPSNSENKTLNIYEAVGYSSSFVGNGSTLKGKLLGSISGTKMYNGVNQSYKFTNPEDLVNYLTLTNNGLYLTTDENVEVGTGAGSYSNNYLSITSLSVKITYNYALTVTYNANDGVQGQLTEDHKKLVMSEDGLFTHKREYGKEYNNQSGLYDIGSFALTKTGYHADSWLYSNTKILQNQSWNGGWNTEDLAAYCGKDLSVGNQSIELLANWEKNQYTINFNGNGATSGSMNGQIFQYSVAQKLTPNAFQKTGYTFSHWNTQSNNSGASYSNEANVNNLTTKNNDTITLYAQWVPNTYTITLNHNEGSSTITNIYVKYDNYWSLTSTGAISIHKLPVLPTRPGYKFLGYYDEHNNQIIDAEGGIIVFTDHFSENTTIVAQWKLNGFVYICTDPDNNIWQPAIPYIYAKDPNDDTLKWQPATPYIYHNSNWIICGD